MNANNLKKAIIRSGLRQKHLAEMLGVSPNTLSRWLAGEFEPTDKKKKELAKILDTTVAYLIGETNNNGPSEEPSTPTMLRDKQIAGELISLLVKVRKQMMEEYPQMDINDQNIVKNLLAKINTLVDSTMEGNEEIA